jgi:hypothetical protein
VETKKYYLSANIQILWILVFGSSVFICVHLWIQIERDANREIGVPGD